ncbi:MAG: NAD(P)-binding domain-containing protein, partial [Candidatus Omnitrophica bacterium]|nr:NAD(P)-binding domain-containing protein [Candidatus Omnitrophota bacterium]
AAGMAVRQYVSGGFAMSDVLKPGAFKNNIGFLEGAITGPMLAGLDLVNKDGGQDIDADVLINDLKKIIERINKASLNEEIIFSELELGAIALAEIYADPQIQKLYQEIIRMRENIENSLNLQYFRAGLKAGSSGIRREKYLRLLEIQKGSPEEGTVGGKGSEKISENDLLIILRDLEDGSGAEQIAAASELEHLLNPQSRSVERSVAGLLSGLSNDSNDLLRDVSSKALIVAFKNNMPWARMEKEAAEHAAELKKTFVNIFTGYLSNDNASVRLIAIEALSMLGVQRPDVWREIALNDPDPEVRYKAVDLIYALGWVKQGYVRTGVKKTLLQMLSDPDNRVASWAYGILAEPIVSSKEIVDTIISMFDTVSPEVKQRFLRMLASNYKVRDNLRAGSFLAEHVDINSVNDKDVREKLKNHSAYLKSYQEDLRERGYLWEQIDMLLAGTPIEKIGEPGQMPKKIIAIIGGTGNIGDPLVKELLEKGNVEVVVGSRKADPEKGIMRNEDAAAIADIILVTVPAQHYPSTMESLIPVMKDDAILVNMSVLMEKRDGKLMYNPPAGFNSAAEETAGLIEKYADGTNIAIVSGLHNFPGEWHGDRKLLLDKHILLFSNDEKAASIVAEYVVRQMRDLRPVIIPDLKQSRYAEMLTSYIIRSKKELLRARPLTELFYFIKENVEALEDQSVHLSKIDLLQDLLEYNRKVLDVELETIYGAASDILDTHLGWLASDRFSLRQKEYIAIGLRRYKDITSDGAIAQKIGAAVDVFDKQLKDLPAKANAVRSLNKLEAKQTIDDVQASIRALVTDTKKLSTGEMFDIAAAYQQNLLTDDQKSLFKKILIRQVFNLEYENEGDISGDYALEPQYSYRIWESADSINAVRMLGAMKQMGWLKADEEKETWYHITAVYIERWARLNITGGDSFDQYKYEFKVTAENVRDYFNKDHFDLSALALDQKDGGNVKLEDVFEDIASENVPDVDSAKASEEYGGIDLRALQSAARPVRGSAVDPAVFLGVTVKQAELQVPLAELDKEWSEIQKKMCKTAMPYNELKVFVAICCSRPDASKQIEKIYTCIDGILKMEEERAVETVPEIKDILACLS